MKQTSILTRTCFSLLFSIGLFLGFLTFKAEAAGTMKYDFENSGGTVQEDRYFLTGDTWTLSSTKKYEYYADGTLKTVRSEDGDFPYEGHYDPNGHLMDPSWSFYTGYLEGIQYDEYPARFYDSEGRLTHFEAVRIDLDTAEPLIVKADYEYDRQNRVSRVSYQTEYLDDDLERISESEARMSTGYVFSYAEDGNYSITSETSYDADQVYRTTFSYDKNRRLVKYDSSSKTISSYDGKLYSNSEVYQYYYDESGNLIREAAYRGGEQAPVSTEYRYRKEGGATQFCDVYQSVQGSDEPEYAYTIKSVFDEEGRVTEENSEALGQYRYEFRDIATEVGSNSRKITD